MSADSTSGVHPPLTTRLLRSKADSSTKHTDLDNPPIVQPSNTTTAKDTDMAPARKKRKTVDVPKYLCLTCDTERISKQFPDYNPSAECEHLIHTCKGCLKSWVEVQVDGGEFVRKIDVGVEGKEEDDKKSGERQEAERIQKEGEVPKGLLFGIKCPHPDCKGVMRDVHVKHAGTRKWHKKFVEMERKFIGDSTPGWRWCMAADCSAGQVVIAPPPIPEIAGEVKEPPTKKPKKGGRKKKEPIPIYEDPAPASVDEANISTCHACGHETCIPCARPYHNGESCTQYQFRIKDHLAEEDAALDKIRTSTKPCPNCKKRIEKNGGCPNMWCSQCRTSFCWNCGDKVDRGYCKCHPMPQAMLQALGQAPPAPAEGWVQGTFPAMYAAPAPIDPEDDPDL